MAVVLLIMTVIMAAMAPVMTTRMSGNKVAQGSGGAGGTSIWKYVEDSGDTDIYYGTASNQRAMIGQNKAETAENARLILNTSDDIPNHLIFRKGTDTLGALRMEQSADSNKNKFVSLLFGSLSEEKALTSGDIVIGNNVTFNSIKNGSLAIGNNVQVEAPTYGRCMAIGNASKVTEINSMAIGTGATGTAMNSISIGFYSEAGESAVAIGHHVQAIGYGSVAIDGNWVGNKSLVAEGTSSIAIKGSTYNDNSIAIGKGAMAGASNVTGSHMIAIGGKDTRAFGDNAIAMGKFALAKSDNTIALGKSSMATSNYAVAIGQSSYAGGTGYTVALGTSAGARSGYAIAIGNKAIAGIDASIGTAEYAIAIGYNAQATATKSIAIGQNAKATTANTIVLGTASETVQIPGSLTVATTNYPSDKNLKNVGKEYSSGLDKIKNLKPYNFTYKDDKTKTPRVGVIAQDLKKVFPDAVSKGKDGFLTIRLEDMFYALINAVKELDQKVTQLIKQESDKDKKIKELEKRIELLEQKLK